MTNPERHFLEADVIVAGAGPAGVSAALAAAEAGAKVLLVDTHDQPGGTLHHAGLHTLCGLFLPNADSPVPVSNTARMWAEAIGSRPMRMGRLYELPLAPGQFSVTATDMLSRSQGLEVAFGAELGAGSVLRFRSLVDATGRAHILDMAGLPTAGADPTCPGIGFRLSGVAAKRPSTLQILRHFDRLGYEFLPTIMPWRGPENEIAGVLNVAPEHHGDAPRTLKSRTLEYLETMLRELRTAFIPFAASRLSHVGEEVGLRSGRVFAGPMRIDRSQVRAGGAEDVAVRGFWPVEWWRDLGGPRFVHPHPGGYAIPDECLRVSRSPSIYTAGMSISATPEGQAAVRAAGVCLETGARAGTLAAQDARMEIFHQLVLMPRKSA